MSNVLTCYKHKWLEYFQHIASQLLLLNFISYELIPFWQLTFHVTAFRIIVNHTILECLFPMLIAKYFILSNCLLGYFQ